MDTEKIFVIGDVHGCLYTLEKMLQYWKPSQEQLIFVGDLIDRGNFSPQCVQLVKKLVKKDKAICLMGNHEYACINALITNPKQDWFGGMGKQLISQYQKFGYDLKKDAKWFEELPLIWQNEKFIISHAGISKKAQNPLYLTHKESVLWTRSALKNIPGKIQIHGHTPHFENPTYLKDSNSWNIDSAAVYSYTLSGLKFQSNGIFIEKISVDTFNKDVPKKYDLSE